jgi:hypothetical protein
MGVFVYLDEVDKHYEAAKCAESVHPPKDECYGRTCPARRSRGPSLFFTALPKVVS